MLCTLSAIATDQANFTQEIMKKVGKFVGYASTHPGGIIMYRKSDMILVIHSDASYLSEPKVRSRAGYYWFMLSNCPIAPDNGKVSNIAQLIKIVMTSAVEAEICALCINAQEVVPERMTLQEMTHP